MYYIITHTCTQAFICSYNAIPQRCTGLISKHYFTKTGRQQQLQRDLTQDHGLHADVHSSDAMSCRILTWGEEKKIDPFNTRPIQSMEEGREPGSAWQGTLLPLCHSWRSIIPWPSCIFTSETHARRAQQV